MFEACIYLLPIPHQTMVSSKDCFVVFCPLFGPLVLPLTSLHLSTEINFGVCHLLVHGRIIAEAMQDHSLQHLGSLGHRTAIDCSADILKQLFRSEEQSLIWPLKDFASKFPHSYHICSLQKQLWCAPAGQQQPITCPSRQPSLLYFHPCYWIRVWSDRLRRCRLLDQSSTRPWGFVTLDPAVSFGQAPKKEVAIFSVLSREKKSQTWWQGCPKGKAALITKHISTEDLWEILPGNNIKAEIQKFIADLLSRSCSSSCFIALL